MSRNQDSRMELPSISEDRRFYEHFQQITGPTEDFQRLLQEAHSNPNVKGQLSLHHSFRNLSELFDIDHHDLQQQRNQLEAIVEHQKQLEACLQTHTNIGRDFAQDVFRTVPQEQLFQAAPRFFRKASGTLETPILQPPSPPPPVIRPATPAPRALPPIPTAPRAQRMFTTSWADKADFLQTLPWFTANPTRIAKISNWDYAWKQPHHDKVTGIWYSKHQPRPHYEGYECHRYALQGHIEWDCPSYECPHCHTYAPGHRPEKCPYHPGPFGDSN